MASPGFRYGSLALLIGIAGILFKTNPSLDDYQDFATVEAKLYLVEDVCPRPIPFLGQSLRDECEAFLQSERSTPLIGGMLSQGSDRRDLFLFSLYSTQLDLETVMPALPRGLLPRYQIQAIGFCNSFIIYRAESL
ncbi:MAG: DUF4359 domain-containing protein [Synechococcales cyanobacterium RM1_1_8]|nr:DUF4359 domain-containing protein [Synechococcales cyanobacterium RM1_1_8]